MLVDSRLEWGGKSWEECYDKAKVEKWALLVPIERFYNYLGILKTHNNGYIILKWIFVRCSSPTMQFDWDGICSFLWSCGYCMAKKFPLFKNIQPLVSCSTNISRNLTLIFSLKKMDETGILLGIFKKHEARRPKVITT